MSLTKTVRSYNPVKSTTLQRFRPRFDRGLRLLAMLTLVVVAFLSFLSWRRYEAASTSGERSREVLDACGALLTSVKDAEAAMRVFVLTGHEKDLAAYQAVLGSLPARQTKLKLVAVLPHQSGLAARINQLADERVAFLANGTQIRQQSGLEAAALYIQTAGARGREKMAELMAVGSQLLSDDYDEQAKMAKIAERRAFDTFLVASLGCALVFALLVLMQRAVNSAIAQRNLAIAELADTSRRWEITLSSIGDGVVATDGEGRVTFLNPVAEKLTGWTQADAVGRAADDVFRIADEESGTLLPSPLARVIETGRVEGLPGPTVLLPKQGEPIAIADSGSPIRTDDGKIVGAVLVFRDIRATREAQRQIEKWHRLFRAGGFGMAVIDSETDILLDLNPAFAAMHGFEESELLAKKFSTLLAASDEPHLRSLRESGKVTFESLHLHHNGHAFPVLTDMTTFRDASGKATERAAYFSDISSRILAERVSRHAQERFKSAVEVVGDIIWTNSAEGKMEGEQKAWSHFTGQTYEEYQGYGWSEAVHPDDLERTLTDWKNAVAEKRKFLIEHRLRRHDGVYRLFAVRALPLFDEQGKIREWVGVHADISDERENLLRMAESEARFRGLATSLPQVIWSTGPDGQFEYTNPAWTDYLGAESVQTGGWESVMHPDDVDSLLPKWREATSAGQAFDFQVRLKSAADGAFRCFLCRSVPLFDATGQVIRWFGSCTDIEEQSERANDLKASNEALRRSNTDLEQFAYAASHDLQEPLRMVALYTQLLGEEYSAQLDDEARYYIGQAKKGALRMETLLHALLSYSLVTTSSVSLESRADANTSVREAMENLESLIARSGAAIHFDDLPTVHLPAVRLTQLFQNLIGNSLKYRREGVRPEVTISAVRQGAERWLFSVKDNGIGIAPEFLNHVFGIFKRLHGQDYEGTGIGLAICQRIIENAGGRIWAESELGQGTTFCFTLPRSR